MSIFILKPNSPLSILSLACLAVLLASCGSSNTSVTSDERNPAACTDFYAYANSDWIAATPIPSGSASIDATTGIAEKNQAALLANLDALAAGQGAASNPDQQALVNLFASRADTAAVERAGLAPLAEDLALIDGVTDIVQLPAAWGALIRRGVQLPVSLKVEVFDDAENSDPDVHTDRLRVSLEPSAPARTPDESQQPEFRGHIARTLELTGVPPIEAADAAVAVAEIEQALAALAAPTEAPAGNVTEAGTAFAMTDLLAAAGVPATLPRLVDDAASAGLGGLLPAFSVADWRGFMRWRLALGFTDYLPTRFADERARWELPVPPPTPGPDVVVDSRIAFLSRVLPRQLDLFFTGRILPADTAARVTDIGREIRAALQRHLDSRTWLNAASRAASHRLAETVELAYPGLDNAAEDAANAGLAVPAMQAGALIANVRAAAGYDLDRRLGLALASRTGRSFSGDAWSRFEARYDFISHAVVLGPVTVQALLEGQNTDAARYGSFGTVLAHELIHMFGAPRDVAFSPRQPLGWIDSADRPYLNAAVDKLEKVYAAWVTAHFQENVKNPRFMGEDLSDLGSVPVALSAWRQSQKDALIALTAGNDEKGFYRAFAFSMRTRQSDAEDRSFITSVPAHAIYSYRVNGPLSNFSSFAARYGCIAGDAMVRGADSRVDLW